MTRLAIHHLVTQIVMSSWLLVWVIMVPLFHVHPETDHHHGEADHVHGGLIHTVFSKDLECEYKGTSHGASRHTNRSVPLLQTNSDVDHHFHHQEIGWVFLASSNKNTLLPVFTTPTIWHQLDWNGIPFNRGTQIEQTLFHLPLQHFSIVLSPRAPPLHLT